MEKWLYWKINVPIYTSCPSISRYMTLWYSTFVNHNVFYTYYRIIIIIRPLINSSNEVFRKWFKQVIQLASELVSITKNWHLRWAQDTRGDNRQLSPNVFWIVFLQVYYYTTPTRYSVINRRGNLDTLQMDVVSSTQDSWMHKTFQPV